MSTPIGPGDWVECVDASLMHSLNTSATLLRVGAIYRVKRVGIDCRPPKIAVVWLAGLASHDPLGAFAASRFRPIYRRDESLLDRLLEPVPSVIETPTRIHEEA